MPTVESQIYNRLAARLLEAIGNGDFFNGTVELDDERFNPRLVVTLIVRRASRCGAIESIAPVWWSYGANYLEESEENDFSWNEFRRYLP
jgi:hypothetical protein